MSARIDPTSSVWRFPARIISTELYRRLGDRDRGKLLVYVGSHILSVPAFLSTGGDTACEGIIPLAPSSDLFSLWRYATGSGTRVTLTNHASDFSPLLRGSVVDGELPTANRWTLTDGSVVGVSANWELIDTFLDRRLASPYRLENGQAVFPVAEPFKKTVTFPSTVYRVGDTSFTDDVIVLGRQSLDRFLWVIDQRKGFTFLRPLFGVVQEPVPLFEFFVYSAAILYTWIAVIWWLYTLGTTDLWAEPRAVLHPIYYNTEVVPAKSDNQYMAFVSVIGALWALMLSSIVIIMFDDIFTISLCEQGGPCMREGELFGALLPILLPVTIITLQQMIQGFYDRAVIPRICVLTEIVLYVATVLALFPWGNHGYLHLSWVLVVCGGIWLVGLEIVKIIASRFSSLGTKMAFGGLLAYLIYVTSLVSVPVFLARLDNDPSPISLLSRVTFTLLLFIVPIELLYGLQLFLADSSKLGSRYEMGLNGF